MKKLFTLIFALSLIGGVAVLNSCQKNVSGCMTSYATNYNSSANEDCNCCTYKGSMIFYCNLATANTLIANGVTTLNYYVNGTFVGSTPATTYWTSPPSCGQSGAVTITENLGTNKSLAYSLVVTDQSGNTLWSPSITVTASPSCTSMLLH